MGFRSLTRAAPIDHREPRSGFAAWRMRLSERIARSGGLFLLGVVVACGIEVLVDWNQTLVEINVLRNAIKQKGDSYVGILAKASDDELAAADKPGLERLSHGIFDDEDAVYVRFTDVTGKVVWDKLAPEFAEKFQHANSEPFVQRYEHLMERDTDRALHDPEGLKAHVANSKYTDFAQAWTDATARVIASVAAPKPASPSRGLVVYQDRLRDEKHQKDDSISYAIGTVLGEDGKDIGTVIVAFDMARTNGAVRLKYVKFSGLCSFFVALILVQNVMSRRNKLWLLELQSKYAAAKSALRDAMPGADVRCAALSASGAVEQARGPLDGMVWSAADEGGSLLVAVVDPDGDGVDAAAVGLHVARTFLGRRRGGTRPALEDELRALGEAASNIPLTRPLEALLLRVDASTGAYEALGGSLAQLRVLGGATVESVDLRPIEGDAPAGIVGPLHRASGTLDAGRSIVAICCDDSKVEGRSFADAIGKYLARTHEPRAAVPAADAAIWARGKSAALAGSDIGIVAVTRGA
jgi:hypothetical protein